MKRTFYSAIGSPAAWAPGNNVKHDLDLLGHSDGNGALSTSDCDIGLAAGFS